MCILDRKRFDCGCQYDERDYCRRPAPEMMPTLTNQLGNGCTATDPKRPPEVIEYPNCCTLQCCSLHVNGQQLLVRAAEREAGVERGAREGLDFEAKQLEDSAVADSDPGIEEDTEVEMDFEEIQRAKRYDILRDRQMFAFEELQKHAECRKVLKPGEKNFQGIMTAKRERLGVGPFDDDDTKQQKWKLFKLFQPENRIRMRRARKNGQQVEVFERPKFEKKGDDELYKLYEQQTEELIEYLAYQHKKFQSRIPPPQEPAIKTKRQCQLRDTTKMEPMMFEMEMDDLMD